MENKKIKNATEVSLLGINFRSQLESRIYKTLREEGFFPQYEKVTFTLAPKLKPTISFFKRIGKKFKLDMAALRPITYTPDFTFNYNGTFIIIEAKGFENDVYPVKRNLFRRHLEKNLKNAMFFEVRTKKELLEAIELIKNEKTV